MPMQVTCGRCSRVLEYSGDPPSFCAYCGQALVDTPSHPTGEYGGSTVTLAKAAKEAPLPAVVGDYRIVRRLGQGGMGSVYEAEEAATGRRVALKVIAAPDASSRDAIERFLQEGRLASLIGHPRCVFVLAVREVAGQPYIVMELMPGETLRDLVERQGPLPPTEAVAKILDVIEGLQEAHRLQVIHRDVKPSNCFLDEGGRVKVGDFGLAKSLSGSAHLTRTGTFLGTPHFASPEQVRGEPVGPQTDVYSVSATLYYLLTGQPPFAGADAAATLARIVSDPIRPPRSLRPELPAALERVVLRGLQRDRKERYPDLEALRQALLPFLPGRPTIGGVGLRFAAYLIDELILSLAAGAVAVAVQILRPDSSEGVSRQALALSLGELAGWFLYFFVQDGLWGGTLGKHWLRLRVRNASGTEAPGLGQVFWRTHLFFGLLRLDDLLGTLAEFAPTLRPHWWHSAWMVPALSVLGLVLLVATMRKRNGYRGPHELLSGTRVVQLPWPARHRKLPRAGGWLLAHHSQPGPLPAGVPAQVGELTVRAVLRWTADEKMLLAEDPSLGRSLLVWLRPATEPPLDPARRELGRKTRLRWLTHGQFDGQRWDAFLAPTGSPLTELIATEGRLDWPEAYHVLDQLAEELAAACRDGTLPEPLSPAQMWVEADGRVQLADHVLTDHGASSCSGPAQERALALLRQTAVLALEGRPREEKESGPIRRPVPLHSRPLLDRLLGLGQPFAESDEIRTALEALRERPAQVTVGLRAGHLAVLVFCMTLGLIGMFTFTFFFVQGAPPPFKESGAEPAQPVVYSVAAYYRAVQVGLAVSALWPLLWIAWAFLFRGGLTFRLMGIAVARSDGRPAGRLTCAVRAALVWLPVLAILAIPLAGPLWMTTLTSDGLIALWWKCWLGALALLALYLVVALLLPRQSLHDVLAGTFLVPR